MIHPGVRNDGISCFSNIRVFKTDVTQLSERRKLKPDFTSEIS